MKFIRILAKILVVAGVFAVLLTAAAFNPTVQTWVVNRALTRHFGPKVSVGSVWAGLSSVHIADLHVDFDDVVLTVPTLDAQLPVKTALWDRRLLVGSLAAKGWTLDLSHKPAAKGEAAKAPPAPSSPGREGLAAPNRGSSNASQNVVRVLSDLLGNWSLPCDLSLEAVDLEGAVAFTAASDQPPGRIHAILKGGGLAAGRPGDFALDVIESAGTAKRPFDSVSAQGRLIVGMGTARSFNRFEFVGSVSSRGASLPAGLTLAAAIATQDTTQARTLTLELKRDDRALAHLEAALPKDGAGISGTWKLNVQDADVARLKPDGRFPAITAMGEGKFDTDVAMTSVHATGGAKLSGNGWGKVATSLVHVGNATIETDFDLRHGGQSLQIDRLNVSIAGSNPVADVQSAQPFTFDESTWEMKPSDPGADLLRGSLRDFPLSWLPGIAGGFTLHGSNLTGDFVVRKNNGEITLRSKAPWLARAVTLQRAGRVVAEGLDLSLSLLAEYAPREGWRFRGSPLSIDRRGSHVATIEATVSPPAKAGGGFVVTGNWTADLAGLDDPPAHAVTNSVSSAKATGDFTATAYSGSSADVQGKVTIVAQEPGYSINANGRAFLDVNGRITFQGLAKVMAGSSESEFSSDGTWMQGKNEQRLDLKLTSTKVALEHVGILASHLPEPFRAIRSAVTSAGSDAAQKPATKRDSQPFWGDVVGRVYFNFYQLLAGNREWHEVAGAFVLDRSSLRLNDGRGSLAPPKTETPAASSTKKKATLPREVAKIDPSASKATAEGLVVFDAAAESPYKSKVTVTIDPIDMARLIGVSPPGKKPTIEGTCTVTDAISSSGRNWEDLVSHRREEIKLSSKGGILRLLQTTAAQSISEIPTPVADTLAPIGSAVGYLLGIKEGAPKPGKSIYTKAGEAVLEFSQRVAEIRYDQMSLTAIRNADRTINLQTFALTAPTENLAGTGKIDFVRERSVGEQPLGLDVQLGVRGPSADYLKTAGLLSDEKDAQGYIQLKQPIHFGGTLEQIDEGQWRELLVKAATQSEPKGKKGG